MALLDIFKKKQPKEKEKIKEAKEVKKTPKVKAEKKEPSKKKEIKPVAPKHKKISKFAYKVLKYPHITEKATSLTASNQYIFNVLANSNKAETKKAIEDIYGVNVISVKIINIHPKKRRLGRTIGYKSGYKKAIVKIKEGQKIEVLPR